MISAGNFMLVYPQVNDFLRDSERRDVENAKFFRTGVRPIGEKTIFEAEVFQRATGAICGLIFAQTVRGFSKLVDQPGHS